VVLQFVTCEEVQEFIDAYIDGELGLVTNLEIEGHLGECEACRSEHQGHANVRALVQGGAQYFNAPELLKKRIEKQLKAGQSQTFSSRHWLAVAATVILAVSGVLSWTIFSARSQSHNDEQLAQEVVSSHVRSMMLDHLVDVPSSDQHTVKPWFNGKLDFAPEVKDLAAQGFPLVGGRLDYIDSRTVAALVYQRRKHSINLFIWPSTRSDQSAQQFSNHGYNIIHWTQSGANYGAVSDVNSADLSEFAKLVSR
jgi:anti-sigma factor RsiW